MSKIEILKEEELVFLKDNLHLYVNDFNSSTNKELIKSIGHNPFVQSKFEMEELDLKISNKFQGDLEYENVIKVYTELKYLTNSQASDERLWAGLCLTKFWDYTKIRWNIEENIHVNNVKNHYFFGYGAKRSLTRNAISRLWWIGRLTYDHTANNPYELTELVCRNSNFIQDTLERNFSNNPKIILPFLRGVKRAELDGLILSKTSFKRLAIYLNLLGGTYILDVIPKKVIEEKVYVYAMKGMKEYETRNSITRQ
ncbi:hypothetical protein SAMN04488569_10705 [Marinilactibacillus piezotolerans]|uniref:Uncharacterized protein n=1 Tax=Marinilactibacillus piezotolerans TaxID=258723 RepID=A0A1I4BH69_9LACT|nr:DUF6339 family protein [Marinilactibacillus piezotolerans]SFK67296.1 hypothetical protein SAMN04488569_10705 [Marinilactibacillus piezotolerans]